MRTVTLGSQRPDVLGVGPLSVAGDLGLRPFGPRFPGLAPRVSDRRLLAPRPQVAGTRVPASKSQAALHNRLLHLRGSGPGAHPSVSGVHPPRVHIIRFHLPPVEISGRRPPNQTGIQELSPSTRRRTGPRGQIGLSPPPLPGRLPGPAPPEGRKPRKRWQGGRSPCPSPCSAEPLEDPRRRRKRWGTIVTPTRSGPILRAPRGHHASWGPGWEPEGSRCG